MCMAPEVEAAALSPPQIRRINLRPSIWEACTLPATCYQFAALIEMDIDMNCRLKTHLIQPDIQFEIFVAVRVEVIGVYLHSYKQDSGPALEFKLCITLLEYVAACRLIVSHIKIIKCTILPLWAEGMAKGPMPAMTSATICPVWNSSVSRLCSCSSREFQYTYRLGQYAIYRHKQCRIDHGPTLEKSSLKRAPCWLTSVSSLSSPATTSILKTLYLFCIVPTCMKTVHLHATEA